MKEVVGKSTFSVLFGWAYRRIWSGRSIQRLEIINWSILAICLAVLLSGYRFRIIAIPVTTFTFFVLFALVPITAGMAMSRIQFIAGPTDIAVTTLPIKPRSVVWSQFLALSLTWLQVAAPLILLAVLFNEVGSYGLDVDFRQSWLYGHNNTPILGWILTRLSIDYLHALLAMQTLPWSEGEALIPLMGLIAVGWPVLPPALALWWTCKAEGRRGLSLVGYVASLGVYALLLVSIYVFALGHMAQLSRFMGQWYDSSTVLKDLLSDSHRGWLHGIGFVGVTSLVVGIITLIVCILKWGRSMR